MALEVMAFPDVSLDQICGMVPEFAAFEPEIQQQVATDALYAQYLDRQRAEIAGLRREEETAIPSDFTYVGLPGLSNELAAKLHRIRPANLAEAGRIEGMTPAALTLILAHVRKIGRKSMAS